MTTELLQDPSAFSALRDEWNELLANSESDCVFLTWEWLHTCWKHLAGDRRLSIIAVRQDGRLVGIAPLAARKSDPLRPMPFSSLEFLGSGTVGSDYLDLILRRGYETDALQAMAESLGQIDQPLELNQLQSQSAAARLAERVCALGWKTRQAKTNVCPFIPFAGRSWDEYLASLGSEHRYNFQRKSKKLAREGEVVFERAQTPEQCGELFELLVSLHHKRWTSRAESSDAFHTPAHLAFHREFAQLALCRGWLRLYVLRVAGAPLSALYGFRYGSKFCFFQSGFDPQHARLSLGLLTMGLAIRSALEEGAGEYDLLHGAEEYKFHWASDSRDLFRLELFPSGLRGLLLQRAVSATRSTRRLARKVLQKGRQAG